MEDDSLDFGDLGQEDSGSTSTTTSSPSHKTVNVNLRFGTEVYTSDEHDCRNCDDDMECVVVVDRLGRQDDGLDEVAIPACESCRDAIIESAKREHYDTRTER